jgi:hypothetical protein
VLLRWMPGATAAAACDSVACSVRGPRPARTSCSCRRSQRPARRSRTGSVRGACGLRQTACPPPRSARPRRATAAAVRCAAAAPPPLCARQPRPRRRRRGGYRAGRAPARRSRPGSGVAQTAAAAPAARGPPGAAAARAAAAGREGREVRVWCRGAGAGRALVRSSRPRSLTNFLRRARWSSLEL